MCPSFGIPLPHLFPARGTSMYQPHLALHGFPPRHLEKSSNYFPFHVCSLQLFEKFQIDFQPSNAASILIRFKHWKKYSDEPLIKLTLQSIFPAPGRLHWLLALAFAKCSRLLSSWIILSETRARPVFGCSVWVSVSASCQGCENESWEN